MEFLLRLKDLIKIVIPRVLCGETLDLALLTVFLCARTFLSIHLAELTSTLTRSMIAIDHKNFLLQLINLVILSVPASFCNSFLDFLNHRLANRFRKRITDYFQKKYFKNIIFYQLTNIDSRIQNPDQIMTNDIEKWATSLSTLYSNFTKPLLDLILFTRKLSETIGWTGPFFCMIWYIVAGTLVKFISPPFGRLTAVEQQLEGNYRTCHSDIVTYSEEIAFYQGESWEKTRILDNFNVSTYYLQ